MLNGVSVLQKFWFNAVDTLTYILNRIVVRPILGKTPYEILRGRKPTLDYFKQSHIILEKPTMKVKGSLNVTFDESHPPPKTLPLEDDLVEEEAIKQTTLAISTTEAEYVSARKACQQALWMKQALIDYNIHLDDILMISKEKAVVSSDSEGSEADDFDVVIGSMTIKKVYYVEGLGHNLFSVGQFCDKGLEVAFQKSTCFVRNEDGVDLITGDRTSNLYTISLNEVASNSSTCLLAKASSSQSWLWHQCLSHLNFDTNNNLVKNNLVQGLPKIKFEKDHLCSACEQGKIHQKHHKSKMAFASNKPLYILHMDLCGPMRVQSINGKRYVLVFVDDYSRYTWVFFLHSKDEASNVIISFIKKTQVNIQLQVQRVRTDNGIEFKNKSLAKFFDEDVRKLKAKRDIGVFVGYSKESAAFRIYNKRTRKIHESVNVNFDEISEMASKQFSLEPALRDADSVSSMQEELEQFVRLKVWRLVPRPEGKTIIKTKCIFKNKKDESSLVIRNKARLVAVGY
nr:retrovirus-related Pol polyprotein from transposon TNT 1-94 [Tanacetum cinerariifolium]